MPNKDDDALLDDSNLYADAPELKASSSNSPSNIHHHHRSGSSGGDGGSTISTVSSKHGSSLSAGTGNAFLAAEVHSGINAPVNTSDNLKPPSTGDTSHIHDTIPAAAATSAAGTPTRSRKSKNKDKKIPPSSSARESVLTSPTRSSYQRTLATVEQFVPGAVEAAHTHISGTAGESAHNTTAVSTATQTHNRSEIKQPWRPSSPHPEPAHIRAGYYSKHTESHILSRSTQSAHALREEGLSFNNPNNPRNSRGSTTPVRSIRPRKSVESLLNDTANSRQRSSSLSPFRRSSPASIMTANLGRQKQQQLHAPPDVPGAHVYRDLNLGKCSYCTHNLLDLWTRKFGAPAGLNTSDISGTNNIRDTEASSSSDSSSSSSSEDEGVGHIKKRKSREHSKQGGKSKSSKVRKGLNTSAIKKRDGESRKHKRDKEKTKNKSRISKSKDRPLPSSSSASSSFTSGSSDLSASDVDYNSDHNLNPNVEHMKVCSCLQYWWGD